MSLSDWIRQIHRWVSIAFAATVVANFVTLGLGSGEPPAWVTYAPLFPLGLLLFTGLYLFVLPYAARWRGGRRPGGTGGRARDGRPDRPRSNPDESFESATIPE